MIVRTDKSNPILPTMMILRKRKKMVTKLLATTIDLQNPVDILLNIFTLRKTLRMLSWINHFLNNCTKSKVIGPPTADKDLVQTKFLIKREQNLYSNTENFEISRQQLNLKNESRRYLRMSRSYTRRLSSFYSKKLALAEKLVEKAPLETIHGGVTLTMARMRD